MSEVAATVVVPSRAGASRLPVLLRALAAQDAEFAWEVVIVIDGVVDDSEQVIASFPEVPARTVVLAENQGRSAALNAGFDAARGDVLIRCDDDLEPDSDYVRLHVELHRGPERRGVIGLCRNVFPATSYAKAYGVQADVRFRETAYQTEAGHFWRYWAGNCSVTRADFDKVGHYDVNFRAYGWEDVDWGFRLRRTGATVLLAPQLEVRHHLAATSAKERALRAFYSGAARSRFEAKHGLQERRLATPGMGARVWGFLVRTAAIAARESTIRRAGAAVDRMLPRLPPYLAEKSVALLVESSASSGYRVAQSRLGPVDGSS